MNIPFNHRSNPLFHGMHPFCMGSCLVLFWQKSFQDFPFLCFSFPRERRSQEIRHSQAQRFPVCFLPAFLPLIPRKQGKDLIFQGVCEELRAAEGARLELAEQHSLYLPLIPSLLVPGYQVWDIRKSSSKRSTLLFRRDLGKNWGYRRSFWDAGSQIREGAAPSIQGAESHPNIWCFSIGFDAFPVVSPGAAPSASSLLPGGVVMDILKE